MGLGSIFSTGAGRVKRDAANAAAARQGRASNLTRLIGNTFDDPRREQQTQDFMSALRGQLGDATTRGFTDAARRTKFRTAGAGLTGGSVDVSRQKRGLEDLFRRRISDESQVQDAGNELRTQDRATRQSLIDSAYGVADVGQDATRSLLGQRGKLAGYRSTLLPQAFQGVGNAWGSTYSAGAETGDYDRARGYWGA